MKKEILTRHSTRSFSPSPLSKDERQKLQFLQAKRAVPFAGTCRSVFIPSGEKNLSNFAAYGLLNGASDHLALVTLDSPDGWLNAGWILAQWSLEVESAGFGACIVGGTYRHSLEELVPVQPGEILASVFFYGRPGGQSNFIQRTISRLVPRNRRPLSAILPAPSEQSVWLKAAEAVRLAPSALNAQPWRLSVDNDWLDFYTEKPLRQPHSMHRLDMGIALAFASAQLEESGCRHEVLKRKAPERFGSYIASIHLI